MKNKKMYNEYLEPLAIAYIRKVASRFGYKTKVDNGLIYLDDSKDIRIDSLSLVDIMNDFYKSFKTEDLFMDLHYALARLAGLINTRLFLLIMVTVDMKNKTTKSKNVARILDYKIQ